MIHNYRWRLGLAPGEAKYDALEKRLAACPGIAVPTITLEGDANGAPHPDPKVYAGKFSGKYAHRLITGGIGHNLPQEARRPLRTPSSKWRALETKRVWRAGGLPAALRRCRDGTVNEFGSLFGEG